MACNIVGGFAAEKMRVMSCKSYNFVLKRALHSVVAIVYLSVTFCGLIFGDLRTYLGKQ